MTTNIEALAKIMKGASDEAIRSVFQRIAETDGVEAAGRFMIALNK